MANKSGGLQLNRKVGQGIHIFVGDVEIRIELRHVQPGSAKIGIIADPDKVTIRREEQMWERKSSSRDTLDS